MKTLPFAVSDVGGSIAQAHRPHILSEFCATPHSTVAKMHGGEDAYKHSHPNETTTQPHTSHCCAVSSARRNLLQLFIRLKYALHAGWTLICVRTAFMSMNHCTVRTL